VGRPDFPKSLKEFQARFREDDACRKYLAACRWPDGFRCARCGQGAAFELPQRPLWQCKARGRQTTHTPGLSAVQRQRQIGISYETAWAVLHKLRRAVVNPEREALKDKVEVDETSLGGPEAALKRGRQLLEKALIVGAVEVRGTAAGRVRLQVVPDASARSLTGFVKRTVAPGTLILTDGRGAYAPLSDIGYGHRPRTQGPPSGRPSSCRTSTAFLATSRPGFAAPTTASVTITSRHTWTSSPFVSTGGARRWRPSRPFSALPRAPTDPRPTRCCTLRSQPDRQLSAYQTRAIADRSCSEMSHQSKKR
jgi:hypothetical protein